MLFLGILDQAAVNARILLHCKNYKNNRNVKITAHDCLRELSLALVKPQLEERVTMITLRANLKYGIMSILKTDQPAGAADERQRLAKQHRCQVCKRGKDKKTTAVCPSCFRPMCDEHRAYICTECMGEN